MLDCMSIDVLKIDVYFFLHQSELLPLVGEEFNVMTKFSRTVSVTFILTMLNWQHLAAHSLPNLSR